MTYATTTCIYSQPLATSTCLTTETQYFEGGAFATSSIIIADEVQGVIMVLLVILGVLTATLLAKYWK